MMIGWLMVSVGFISFVSFRSHVLMMLLSLEFVMLGVFIILVFYVSVSVGELYFLLVFLTFMVCEGALGLSLIVLLNKTHGNDFLAGLSMLEC